MRRCPLAHDLNWATEHCSTEQTAYVVVLMPPADKKVTACICWPAQLHVLVANAYVFGMGLSSAVTALSPSGTTCVCLRQLAHSCLPSDSEPPAHGLVCLWSRMRASCEANLIRIRLRCGPSSSGL